VIAAAIAGYISIILAAASTGFMFGIQPLLHTDASGVPLYMPYSLSVTLPTMILEHVLGFGFLEALVTGLIFAYVQKTDHTILYEVASKSRTTKIKRAVPA
ncbi:MAG: energy-coupling factor ABC transporter permease, partial [Methanotrichaceae archaeon]|nr:energy-coupling factor ABC transporter permease [Methanotrichaceae archaeon]